MSESSLFLLRKWYAKHPIEAFIRYRRDGRSFFGNVWIVTGWRWASKAARVGRIAVSERPLSTPSPPPLPMTVSC